MDQTQIMAAPAEVAARDGVTKQAVTKLARRLADEHALPVERDGRGRIIRFSLAHYDHLRGSFDSSAKVSAARGEPPAAASGEQASLSATSRDEALRQEAWLRVNREKLRRQEDLDQLVRADSLRQALSTCGQEIRALMMRLPNRADDLALAVSREGVHGLRVLLRQIAFEMGGQVADRLAGIGAEAPEHDGLLEGEEL